MAQRLLSAIGQILLPVDRTPQTPQTMDEGGGTADTPARMTADGSPRVRILNTHNTHLQARNMRYLNISDIVHATRSFAPPGTREFPAAKVAQVA